MLWISTLQKDFFYNRCHDDNEGDLSQNLSVIISPDGDAWIRTYHPMNKYLRFRNSLGGTNSPCVHNALLILAEAIRLDNENIINNDIKIINYKEDIEIISVLEYKSLLEDRDTLNKLYEKGVDNWEGYND